MMKVVRAKDISRGDLITEGLVFLTEADNNGNLIFSFALGQTHADPYAKVLRFARVSERDMRRVETMTRAGELLD